MPRRGGPTQPFQAFLDEHAETVGAFLRGLVGPDDAEDCAQETFIAALGAYPRFDGRNGRAWVLTIARNKAIDHVRRSRVPAEGLDSPGTVQAGGSELSTVVYTIKVDDALKGEFGAKPIVTVTMLGNLKAEAAGDVQRLARMDLNPDMSVGGEYVLFTTAPSAVGLSTTVGLGQGLFRIFANADGRDLAANELNNLGLFDGPVQYSELAQAVADLLAQ